MLKPFTSYTSFASWVVSAVLATAFFGLTSCSTTSETDKQPKPVAEDTAPETVTDTQTLENAIREAQNRQAWSKYIQLSQQLWAQTDAANQLAIEYQVWSTLKALPQAERARLSQQTPTQAPLQDWLALVQATQQRPVWQSQALRDLAEFYPQALYNHHLLPQLQARLAKPRQIKQVAVFLPFSGPYAVISEQIRNGLLKNHFTNYADTQLRFYDSANLDKLAERYQNAVRDGAEWVIGPLTKEALAELAKLRPNNVLALNQPATDTFDYFNYLSATEALQIVQKLHLSGHRRIGVLSSTAASDADLATEIAQYWQQQPEQQVILKTYPAKNPNLREALGNVINETESQARKNNLYWLLRESIEFTPRTRQDLDAIVVVGNNERLSVFKPQFDFFDLKQPLYATSKITPPQLDKTPANPDLSGLIFPTMTAAIYPSPLNTPFEAFGWDSLTLVMNQNKLAPGLCLNNGMTGRLTQNGSAADHLYRWAEYDSTGLAKPLIPPTSPPPPQ